MQGWRTGMEDAHITISSLGGTLERWSLFGVFDGHGGREVAAFCKIHMPDLVRRRLEEQLNSKKASCGQALIDSFHAIDDMLRKQEYRQEILSLKPQKEAPKEDVIQDSPRELQSVQDVERSSKKPEVVALLQETIRGDLAKAREKGSLSRQEAHQVMMKMALLKRLEGQQTAGEASADTEVAKNVGCTAICVLLNDDEVICGNAGDSRAVLCRKGKAVELSHDHKPNSDVERQRIEAAGGHVEESAVGQRVHYRVMGNLNLSRSIGDLEYKQSPELGPERQMICATPDIIRIPLHEDDEFIVLACDGIWDVKTNQEVCDFVRERLAGGESLPSIVEALLDDCIAVDPKETGGLGGDNMTCIIVQLVPEASEEAHQPPPSTIHGSFLTRTGL